MSVEVCISANGDITNMNGETGTIKSLNYPNHYAYPAEYTHTWYIEGALTDKRVGLIVRDFSTELCCDKVTVSLIKCSSTSANTKGQIDVRNT